MAKVTTPAVLRDIRTLFHAGTNNGVTDAQLLDRFRARSDQSSSEDAFASLMDRHGPMVLGVCRRALSNPDDIADAFQATFLILVRKADSVRVEDSLGRWLYGVSRRVSTRAKRAAARRSAREIQEIELAAEPSADADLSELRAVLDEEIDRLPAKYRAAVVLCELDGVGQDEAARQLGCAVGTVKSRLSRAREKLRWRLMRRGIAPSAWSVYAKSKSPVVPAELIDSTVKTAFVKVNVIISPSVTLLIQGVLRAMFLKKLSIVAIAIVVGLATATGAGVLARQAVSNRQRTPSDGQREFHKAVVTNESNNAPFDALEMENEEQLTDQIAYLGLDVELVLAETRARMAGINSLNGELIDVQLHREKSAANDAQIESIKLRLEDARKEYLSKIKEYNRKQAQLSKHESEWRRISQENQKRAAELDAMQKTRRENKGSTSTKPVPVQSAASDTPGISPSLEKRLSGIEGKLDEVLRALADLKRQERQ